MQLVSSLVRGEMLSRIDKSLANPTQAQLDYLKKTPLGDVAKNGYQGQGGFMKNQAERDHVDNDGLGKAWWPQDEKEAILRSAYIKAVEIALNAGVRKPILTLWVRGMTRFEASVVETDTEILVVWLTPDPPPEAPVPPADTVKPKLDEGVFAIASPERIQKYVAMLDTKGYDTKNRVEEFVPGAKVFNVISY
jgi:hypothetical protein